MKRIETLEELHDIINAEICEEYNSGFNIAHGTEGQTPLKVEDVKITTSYFKGNIIFNAMHIPSDYEMAGLMIFKHGDK